MEPILLANILHSTITQHKISNRQPASQSDTKFPIASPPWRRSKFHQVRDPDVEPWKFCSAQTSEITRGQQAITSPSSSLADLLRTDGGEGLNSSHERIVSHTKKIRNQLCPFLLLCRVVSRPHKLRRRHNERLKASPRNNTGRDGDEDVTCPRSFTRSGENQNFEFFFLGSQSSSCSHYIIVSRSDSVPLIRRWDIHN